MDDDPRVEALQRDVHDLEHDAEEAADNVARYLAPRVIPIVAALLVIAWWIGRKRRHRADN